MAYEKMKEYIKPVVFLGVMAVGTYLNCLIQVSAGVTPNVLTTVVPGAVGIFAVWRFGRRMRYTRKL